MSRRDMLARLFRPVRAAASALPLKPAAPPRPAGTVPAADPLSRPAAPLPTPTPGPVAAAGADGAFPDESIVGNLDQLAVISGRDCLAYQGEACTVCHDRCPVLGAIVVVDALPHVEPALCIGCGKCHDVCPAPDNAVRVVKRPPGLPRPISATIRPREASPGAGGSSVPPASPASDPNPHSPFPSLEPRREIEDV